MHCTANKINSKRVETHMRQACGRERLDKQEYRLAEAIVRATEQDGRITRQPMVEPLGSTEELPPGADEGRQGGTQSHKKQKRPPPQPKHDLASSPSGAETFPPP